MYYFLNLVFSELSLADISNLENINNLTIRNMVDLFIIYVIFCPVIIMTKCVNYFIYLSCVLMKMRATRIDWLVNIEKKNIQ